MPITIKPVSLKKVARLSAQVKNINEAESKSSPWNSRHRLLFSANLFRLLTTDGSTFLEWNIPTEGGSSDDFDVVVNAGLFNAIATKLSDNQPVELSSSGELLTIHQSQRNLRLKVYPTADYPTPDLTLEAGSEGATSWSYNTKQLASSLEFATPFIDAENNHPARSIATLKTDGVLITGTCTHVVKVTGLDEIPMQLSFKQDIAKTVYSYLNNIGETTNIAFLGENYVFSCPKQGHRLYVASESRSFELRLQRLEAMNSERFKVDRDLMQASLLCLSTVVAAAEKPMRLRFRGYDNLASVTISTPEHQHSAISTDEIDIIRTFHQPGGTPIPRDETIQFRPQETELQLNSEPLCKVLSKMNTVTLELAHYPEKDFFVITEQHEVNTDICRSVMMTVKSFSNRMEAPNEHLGAEVTEEVNQLNTNGEENLEMAQEDQNEDHLLEVVSLTAHPNGTGGRHKGRHSK